MIKKNKMLLVTLTSLFVFTGCDVEVKNTSTTEINLDQYQCLMKLKKYEGVEKKFKFKDRSHNYVYFLKNNSVKELSKEVDNSLNDDNIITLKEYYDIIKKAKEMSLNDEKDNIEKLKKEIKDLEVIPVLTEKIETKETSTLTLVEDTKEEIKEETK